MFTARYRLSPYAIQTRFFFKGLIRDISNVKIMKHTGNLIVKSEISFYQTQFCIFLFVCFNKI